MRKQIWLSKFVSGFCTTGSVMKKRKSWSSHLCTFCQQCKETTDHIIQCNCEQSWTQYSKYIQKFFKYMQKVHTDAIIISIFKSTVSTSTSSSFTYSVPTYKVDQEYKKEAQEQDKIGWKMCLKVICKKMGSPPN